MASQLATGSRLYYLVQNGIVSEGILVFCKYLGKFVYIRGDEEATLTKEWKVSAIRITRVQRG
jgi:hypothetical protein